MTEDEHQKEIQRLVEGMKAWTEKNTATPELAGAVLQRSGIITEDGELAPEYGGPKRRSQGKAGHSRS